MGAEQSTETKASNNIPVNFSGKLYQYNWIPSFSSLTNMVPDKAIDNSSDSINNVPEYIDLRREINTLPENKDNYSQVCKSLVTLVNYSLLKSKSLYTFPPSYNYLMFLLKNVIGSEQLHSFGHLSEIIRKFGICSENDYSNYPERPNDDTFMLANPYRHMKLINIPLDIDIIKSKLAKETPLLIGMPIYSNFLKTETEPKLTISNHDDILLGGLCGVIVGYQDTDNHFIVLTTKGKRWGDRGYIFIPYKEVLHNGAEIVQLEIRDELVTLDVEKKQYPNNMQVNNYYQQDVNDNYNGVHNDSINTQGTDDQHCLKTIF